MFYNAKKFNSELKFSNTRNVKDMSGMFCYAEAFNQPLDFDTRNLENIKWMFYDAKSFNSKLNFIDTSKIKNMQGAFQKASKFNQDISNWNIQAVTDFSDMFEGANAFKQDLSKWKSNPNWK
ncbi:BspA family leucine-rich repeat surface protein [Mycoplasmopsis bovis]|nr:BspA family leucine-rich repeat surface protein [Mycoplasmopsis bovis]